MKKRHSGYLKSDDRILQEAFYTHGKSEKEVRGHGQRKLFSMIKINMLQKRKSSNRDL